MDLIKLIEYAHNLPCTIVAGHGLKKTETRKCSLHVYKRDGMSAAATEAHFGALVSSIARLFCFIWKTFHAKYGSWIDNIMER